MKGIVLADFFAIREISGMAPAICGGLQTRLIDGTP
jgi:hypothetical protein